MTKLAPIREIRDWNEEEVRQAVLASGQPAVLRGLVESWPAVARARASTQALVEYLRGMDSGAPVDAVLTPPEMQGRIFYNEAMDGFNFLRNRLSLSAVLEQAVRYAGLARAPAVAVQSALLRDCLPSFSSENRIGILGDNVLPRIWIGNAVTTPTHLDEWRNIGCVVAGRRRFTLFPPEQIANLYIGPLDFAPTGAPVSLVRLSEPDFARFPRFREALTAAVTAELAPGDAIYIPPLWWHNVESLESFNILVNYWWHASDDPQAQLSSAFDCLLHAMLGIRELPAETRVAWLNFTREEFDESNASLRRVRDRLRERDGAAAGAAMGEHITMNWFFGRGQEA